MKSSRGCTNQPRREPHPDFPPFVRPNPPLADLDLSSPRQRRIKSACHTSFVRNAERRARARRASRRRILRRCRADSRSHSARFEVGAVRRWLPNRAVSWTIGDSAPNRSSDPTRRVAQGRHDRVRHGRDASPHVRLHPIPNGGRRRPRGDLFPSAQVRARRRHSIRAGVERRRELAVVPRSRRDRARGVHLRRLDARTTRAQREARGAVRRQPRQARSCREPRARAGGRLHRALCV